MNYGQEYLNKNKRNPLLQKHTVRISEIKGINKKKRKIKYKKLKKIKLLNPPQ